jgi:hypothetical protein
MVAVLHGVRVAGTLTLAHTGNICEALHKQAVL